MIRAIFAGLIVLLAGAAAAATGDDSAMHFLRAIYSHYHGDTKQSPGIFLDTPADYRRYFEPSLAKLMIEDARQATKHQDAPQLDGDPFIDAQDWDISELSIQIDSQTPDRARATVRFRNFREPKVVHLDLVETHHGWRIADIVFNGNDGTLRGLYPNK